MKNFYILSFNYKQLPLEERETFIKNGYKNVLEEHYEGEKIKGYISVETCLRVELYMEIGEKFNLEELKKDLKITKVKVYKADEAIKYLLKVICGLESIIKGEDQILAQIKNAYLRYLEENKTSKLLNIIFNQAIETGKKFRSESKINEKNISLDSITVKFLKSKIGTFEDKKIFIIGVGNLTQSILALLHKIDCVNLTITNRSDHKLMKLKKIFEGTKTVEFNKKYETVAENDIIICATTAPHLILAEENMREFLNDGRHRVFLDLSVPRNVDTKISKYENTELYHLKNIWEEYSKNVQKRDEIVKKYFYIIEEQLEKIYEKFEKREKYLNKDRLVIGTRGSILAVAQAETVKAMLEEKNENLKVEIKTIVTTGDKDLRDFKKMQGKSQKDIFVKEIEKEMLEGTIDLAVHSLKDMPQITPEGLVNACFPLREDNADVLVAKNGRKLAELAKNSVIGTGSTRREAEIRHLQKLGILREDIEIKAIRGNIHTRLRKLDDGEYDAIVLAAAGLKRVGLEGRITESFEPCEFMPAPGQGILCVQCRENDEKILGILKSIENSEVRLMCEAEREFSRIFDGGCHTPIGCSSVIKGDKIEIKGMYNHEGLRIYEEIEGKKEEGIKLARELAERIKNKMKKIGKVYIAGAGCGDERLITLKLKDVLEEAECIIYDRLVNKNILNYAKNGAELIYMGKANTEGGELQEEINRTIVKKGAEGKIVLRLKGGDPFVFGRGGEEIQALLEAGIDFELIPGITSAIAVPAYAGIPVTHRGVNTSFHVYTGHVKMDGSDLDFETMAKLEGTLVFLMGLSNLEKIVGNLIKYGKNPETPVAIIKEGTTTKQQVFTGVMKNIVEIARENKLTSPVVIVIGEVVELRRNMKWFEKKPLKGKKVLLTRNREKQEEMIAKINKFGGEAISAPFINIEYVDFEMPDLSEYSVLLFNSVNSVAGFMRKVQDVRQLGNVKIGVVGEKTALEMEKYKIVPDFYPKEYTVERLAEESMNFSGENDKILFIVSDISPVGAKKEKYNALYKRKFDILEVYKTHKLKYSKAEMEKYVDESDILMFLSSSTFEAFIDSLGADAKLKERVNEKMIAAIGPVTAKTIRKHGMRVDIEAEKYTEEGLFEAIINYDMKEMGQDAN